MVGDMPVPFVFFGLRRLDVFNVWWAFLFFFSCPSCHGMAPLKRFSPSTNPRSRDNSPSQSGIVPVKRFFQINSIQFDTRDERPAGGRAGGGTSKKAGQVSVKCVDSCLLQLYLLLYTWP